MTAQSGDEFWSEVFRRFGVENREGVAAEAQRLGC